MRAVICVKVVSGRLVEEKAANNDILVINPYDLYTVKKIIEKKKESGWEVTCLCMGPLSALDALKRCYALGVDQVILLSDIHFSGSDTYATSYILSSAIKKLDYDIIICGHEAVDGETGQVACGIAANLNRVCLSNVLEVEEEEGNLSVVYQTDSHMKCVRVRPPLVLSFLEYSCNTDISLLALKRAKAKTVTVWDMETLGLCEADCGQSGSKTCVVRSKKAEKQSESNTQFIHGTTDDKCNRIIDIFSSGF